MNRRMGVMIVWVVLGAIVLAGKTVDANSSGFKTVSLTLYDIGVMQVKKEARVDGMEHLNLTVPSAHLDDVLNSLLVTTNDGVKIRGIDYPTVKNIAQAVAAGSIGQSLTDENGEPAFPYLFSETMKLYVGVRVRLLMHGRETEKLEGTVMGVVSDDSGQEAMLGGTDEENEKQLQLASIQQICVMLLTAKGELRKVPLHDIRGIQLASNGEVQALNDLGTELGKSNGFDEKTVAIHLEQGAQGSVAAEYVQQSPTWRMWYRLIAKTDGLFLEGWAQVHNDTTEDWHNVQMTLISGKPDSYLVSVASPRYGERESIVLENDGSMMPQLGAQTADRLLYEYHGGQGYMTGSGFGTGSGVAIGRHASAPSIRSAASIVPDESSTLLDVAESAVQEVAEATVNGEISTYRVTSAVSVAAGSSAMVPVLNRQLTGQLFSQILPGEYRVQTCVRLRNETGVVLQSGLMSFFVDNRFRGQSELLRTEPNDNAILCYGTDDDVSFENELKEVSSDIKRLEWKDASLYLHKLVKREHVYELKNRSGQQRTLGVMVKREKNGRFRTPVNFMEVAEMPNMYLTFIDMDAREEKTLRVVTEEAIQSMTDVDQATLRDLAQLQSIPNRERRVIEQVLEVQDEIERKQDRQNSNAKDMARLQKRIQNDRTNMASLPRMRGRTRIATKLLASILENTDNLALLESMNDELTQSIAKLEREPLLLLQTLAQ